MRVPIAKHRGGAARSSDEGLCNADGAKGLHRSALGSGQPIIGRSH